MAKAVLTARAGRAPGTRSTCGDTRSTCGAAGSASWLLCVLDTGLVPCGPAFSPEGVSPSRLGNDGESPEGRVSRSHMGRDFSARARSPTCHEALRFPSIKQGDGDRAPSQGTHGVATTVADCGWTARSQEAKAPYCEVVGRGLGPRPPDSGHPHSCGWVGCRATQTAESWLCHPVPQPPRELTSRCHKLHHFL